MTRDEEALLLTLDEWQESCLTLPYLHFQEKDAVMSHVFALRAILLSRPAKRTAGTVAAIKGLRGNAT